MNGEGDVIHPHKGILPNLNKEGSPVPAATGMSPEDAMPRQITSHKRTNARLFHLHEVPPLPNHVSQRDAGTPPLMQICPSDKSSEEVACCESCSKTGGPGSSLAAQWLERGHFHCQGPGSVLIQMGTKSP